VKRRTKGILVIVEREGKGGGEGDVMVITGDKGV